MSGGPGDPFRWSTVLQVQEAVTLNTSSREGIFKGAAKPNSLWGLQTNDPFAELKRMRRMESSGRNPLGRSDYPTTERLNMQCAASESVRQGLGSKGQHCESAKIATPSLSLLKPQQPLDVSGRPCPTTSLPSTAMNSEAERVVQPLYWPSLLSPSLFSHNQKNQMDSLKSLLSRCQSEVTGTPCHPTGPFNQFFHKSLLQFNSACVESASSLEPDKGDCNSVKQADSCTSSRQVENNVRLFGFSLKDSASALDVHASALVSSDNLSCHVEGKGTHCNVNKKRMKAEGWDGSNNECPLFSRNRIKVLKKGHAVGRSVDLSKSSSYPELIGALEKLFHMEGELTDANMGWQATYTDDEGDMMLVGDDPWQEFVNIAGKICILTREELQAVSSGALATSAHSRSGEQPFGPHKSKSSEYQDSSWPTTLSLRNPTA